MTSERTSQRILITGASSGLGAEMARQFAARGHDLALGARRLEKLDELKAEIAHASPDSQVETRALDVDDEENVFSVFRAVANTFEGLDRVIVNAGLGKGAPLGTGGFEANKQTATTNFIGALAQIEAAMQIFREQGFGHLVVISSMSAMRGMPKSMTTYAASKVAVAYLAEGLRAELDGNSDIKISVIYPGYIRSEMNAGANTPFMTDTVKGVRAMVEAIEKEKPSACVPPLPWAPMSVVLKHAPLPIFKRLV